MIKFNGEEIRPPKGVFASFTGDVLQIFPTDTQNPVFWVIKFENHTSLSIPRVTVKWEVNVSNESLILEVEYILGDYKIIVKRTGEILLTPMPGKEAKPLEEHQMPPQKFWVGVSGLIKNMNDQITQLTETNAAMRNVVTHAKDAVHRAKERYKMIPVGASKKEMFIAGVIFGKKGKTS